jgi:hypothetical protein
MLVDPWPLPQGLRSSVNLSTICFYDHFLSSRNRNLPATSTSHNTQFEFTLIACWHKLANFVECLVLVNPVHPRVLLPIICFKRMPL